MDGFRAWWSVLLTQVCKSARRRAVETSQKRFSPIVVVGLARLGRPSPMKVCSRLDLKHGCGSGAFLHLISSTRPAKRFFGASSPVVALRKKRSRTWSRLMLFSPLCARGAAYYIHHSPDPDMPNCREP